MIGNDIGKAIAAAFVFLALVGVVVGAALVGLVWWLS